MHQGKIKPSDLNKDYILKTGKVLSDGITEGYGKLKYNEADIKNIALLQKNAYLFSTHKNVAFQEKIASFVNDKDGKLRSFSDFKKDVLKVDKEYNQTYLQAEYQTAVRSAQATKQWEDIQRRAKRYPNLEYRTVGDDHVRDEHKSLHGKIRPITHSFWNTYYPPNGWRCRCYVIQTDKEPNGDDVPTVNKKTVPTLFQHNVGNSKQAFPLAIHPYSKGKPTLSINDQIKSIPYQLVKELANGSKVLIHPFADLSDFSQNYRNALKICEKHKKTTISLRPHLHNEKNPEYLINNSIADLKNQHGKNPNNNIKSAIDQGCEIIVFRINEAKYKGGTNYLLSQIRGNFRSRIKNGNVPNIKSIIIVKGDEIIWKKYKDLME